jgi:hypothetical protein
VRDTLETSKILEITKNYTQDLYISSDCHEFAVR